MSWFICQWQMSNRMVCYCPISVLQPLLSAVGNVLCLGLGRDGFGRSLRGLVLDIRQIKEPAYTAVDGQFWQSSQVKPEKQMSHFAVSATEITKCYMY